MYCPSSTDPDVLCCYQADYSKNSAYGVPDYPPPRSAFRRNDTRPSPPSLVSIEASLRGAGDSVSTVAGGYARITIDPVAGKLTVQVFVNNLMGITGVQLRLRGTGTVLVPLLRFTVPMALQVPYEGYLIRDAVFTHEDLLGPLEKKTMRDLLDLVHRGHVFLTIQTVTYPQQGEIMGYLTRLHQGLL